MTLSSSSSIDRVISPVELADERPLGVLAGPHPVGLVEAVELGAAVVVAGPHVLDALAGLGVPQQRRQVVEGDDHGDVVDRGVGGDADRPVGDRPPAEQPDVAGRGVLPMASSTLIVDCFDTVVL